MKSLKMAIAMKKDIADKKAKLEEIKLCGELKKAITLKALGIEA